MRSGGGKGCTVHPHTVPALSKCMNPHSCARELLAVFPASVYSVCLKLNKLHCTNISQKAILRASLPPPRFSLAFSSLCQANPCTFRLRPNLSIISVQQLKFFYACSHVKLQE